MSDYGLMDIWRLKNPNTQEYSYFSPHHKSYSRIDYFLVNNSLIYNIIDPTIHTIIISDHAPVSITILTQHQSLPPSRWCFNISLLKDKQFQEYFKQEWASFIETNDTPEISACTLWETAKIVMRGKIVSYCAYKKKGRNS